MKIDQGKHMFFTNMCEFKTPILEFILYYIYIIKVETLYVQKILLDNITSSTLYFSFT